MNLTDTLAQRKARSEKNIAPEKWAIMKKSTDLLKDEKLGEKALGTGDSLPPFQLKNAVGKQIDSNEIKSDFLVLSFYRGGWCPYCNMELRALQTILPELQSLVADLIAISPETPDNSLSTSEKNELSFEVLSDVDNTYAKSLGLVFKMPEDLQELYQSAFNIHVDVSNGNDDYELPMPATYIVNADREVVYSFVPEDYTERLDPTQILEVLRTEKGHRY